MEVIKYQENIYKIQQKIKKKDTKYSTQYRVGIITLAPYEIDNGAFKLRI